MKKIYTILCMALVALAATAAPQLPNIKAQLRPEVINNMKNLHQQNLASHFTGVTAPETQTRSWIDDSGREWDLYMSVVAGVPDAFQWSDDQGNPTDEKPSFYMLPLYVVFYEVLSYNAQGQNDIYCALPLMWPAKCLFENPGEYVETVVGPMFEDQEVPTDGYDLSITTIDEFMSDKNPSKIFVMREGASLGAFFPYFNDNDVVTTWSMIPMGEGEISGVEYEPFSDTSRTTQLEFKMYEEEDDFLCVEQTIYLQPVQSGSTQKISNTYEGEASVQGFVLKHYQLDLGQIHLFNTGSVDVNTNSLAELYMDEWGPLQRYEIAIPASNMEVVYGAAGAQEYPWRNKCYGFDFTGSDESITYVTAALYLADGTTSFPMKGVWNMQEVVLDEDELGIFAANVPEAGKLLNCSMPGYCGWATTDGVFVGFNGNVHQTEAPSQFRFGTVEGFELYLTDTYGNDFHATSKQDIIVHNDPKDLAKVSAVSPVGTEPVSVETIDADDNAPVSYFNLQGVRVANPESGLFIRVKGNKATKVMLRK